LEENKRDVFMSSRREFFKKAGIWGAAAVAPIGTTVVMAMPKSEEKEDISHLEPSGNANLLLQGGMIASKPDNYSGIGGIYSINAGVEYQNKVELAVGKDNMLWVRVDGNWKRVVTT
jgi:hypothetical protein